MEQPTKESILKKPWVQSLAGIVVIILLAGGALVYKTLSTQVSIENSLISAPTISINPENEGIIQEVYVKAGDNVAVGQALARVGAEVLSAKVAGIVIAVDNAPGQVFQPMASEPVIQMIDPTALRVVGTLKETEGLSKIKVGDPVSFTVDAFTGKTFSGVVDSISPTSNQTGVVFSISDQRAIQTFDVKVKYDVTANPEFKNGMSVKMNVFIK